MLRSFQARHLLPIRLPGVWSPFMTGGSDDAFIVRPSRHRLLASLVSLSASRTLHAWNLFRIRSLAATLDGATPVVMRRGGEPLDYRS